MERSRYSNDYDVLQVAYVKEFGIETPKDTMVISIQLNENHIVIFPTLPSFHTTRLNVFRQQMLQH